MIQTHINFANVSIIIVLLLYLQTSSLVHSTTVEKLCPIGFEVAYDGDSNPMCFRKKGPEAFADKFKNCTGNLYTLKLLQSLNITPSDQSIWTDYKNLYDGGPFVDWSYTNKTGDLLDTTYEVNRDSLYNVNEELCVVTDPVFNFTAVRCDEKYHRYCFVAVYEVPDDIDDIPKGGCDSLNNPDPNPDPSDDLLDDDEKEIVEIKRSTFRFWSPVPTCLLKVVPKRGPQVRMTWNQSQKACENRGGSLLNRGWRYSNYPIFSSKDDATFPFYPFGIRASANLTLLRYDADHDNALIPPSEWQFDGIMSNDTRLGALLDDSWDFVNNSYIFYDVICEKTIPLRHVNMSVFIDKDDKDNIILTVDDPDLKVDHIYCFTDSSRYYPQPVNVIERKNKPGFVLRFVNDGYYWCIHTDSINFYITESNKLLHIKVKKETQNLYAVKVTSMAHDYTLKDIDDDGGKSIVRDWKKKIEEYVFYSTKYSKTYDSDSYDNHTIWKFKNARPGMDVKHADVVLKRIYLNSRSALLHVKLHPKMLPVKPGQWDDIRVDFMRPAYYCEQKYPLSKRLVLDETSRASECKIYNCIGDFNEGVQLLITAEDTCYTPKPLGAGSSVSVDDPSNVTTTELGITDVMPTAPTLPKSTQSITRHPQHYRASSSDSSEEDDKRPTNSSPINESHNLTEHANNTTESPNNSTESAHNSTVSANYSTESANYPTESANNSTDSTNNSTESENNSTENTIFVQPPTVTHAPRPPTQSTFPTPVLTADPLPTIPETTTTRPLPSEDKLQQVLDSLDTLLNNNTEPVLVANITDTFDQMDIFLAETEQLEIPGNLLHLLDELGGKLYLEGAKEAAAVRENIALLVADAQPEIPVRGLKISTRTSDVFTDDAFEIIRDDINSSQLTAANNEVVIQLPESVATTNRRISFVVFRNDRAFQSSHGLYSVNSRVLSVNIENTTEFQDGEVIDIHLTPLTGDFERNQSRSCAFWKFLDDGSGAGYWSQDGCTFIRAKTAGMLDTCRCDHLTHFAEVLIPRTVFSERNESSLETISIIGCCLSIFGVIWVGVTALMFRSWRRDYSNKIWLQLCVSIFILSISFLIILLAHFEEYDVMCMLTGIVLHFSVLSSFCWMLVAAVLSYRRLVTVFARDASHKLLRASAFAWGAPCAVVGVLLSIAPHSYSGRFDEKNPTTAFCYPSGLALWLSVYAPIAVMLLVNWTLFALIVRSVFASRRNHPNIQIGNRHSSDRNEALRCASVSFFLVFLFGLPWLFGLFSMNVVIAYFFVLLSTFQGFVLFLFFVLGNKKTRDLWLNKLKIKQTKKIPVTSSTYTNNRSTEGNVNSRSGIQGGTIEAKVSRPKSLTSSDNSRFS